MPSCQRSAGKAPLPDSATVTVLVADLYEWVGDEPPALPVAVAARCPMLVDNGSDRHNCLAGDDAQFLLVD